MKKRWIICALVVALCVGTAAFAEESQSRVTFLTEIPADAPSEVSLLNGTSLKFDAQRIAEQLLGGERAQQLSMNEGGNYFYDDDDVAFSVSDGILSYKTRYYYTLFTSVPLYTMWRSMMQVLDCGELSFMSAEAAGQMAQETVQSLMGIEAAVTKVFSITQADYDRLFLEQFGSLDYQFSGDNKMEENCYPHVEYENGEAGYLVYLAQACDDIAIYDDMYLASDVGMYLFGPSIFVLVAPEGVKAIVSDNLAQISTRETVSVCPAQEAAEAFTADRDYLLSDTRYEVTDVRLYYMPDATFDAEGGSAMTPVWAIEANVYPEEIEPYTTCFFIDPETKQVIEP